jgi:hypothetical protein
MERPRKTSENGRRRNGTFDFLRKKARQGLVALGIGAAAFGAYKMTEGGDKDLKQYPQKIEKVTPPIAPPSQTDDDDEIFTNTIENKTTIMVNNRELRLMSAVKSPEDEKFINLLFKDIKKEEIEYYKNKARRNAPVSPEQVYGTDKEIFYMVWNVYREANNAVRFSAGLLKEIGDIEREIARENGKLKSKKADSFAIAKKVIELRKKLSAKQEIKNKEEFEKKSIIKAERLAVLLNVIERTIDKNFPAELVENILKHRAYSWTGEEKYPVPSVLPEDEMISLDSLKEIYSLVSTFVKGKKPLEAKALLRSEIAKILGINISEFPDKITMYVAKSSMPDENGKFNPKILRMTSKHTRDGLLNLQLMIKMNKNHALTVGSHIFYPEMRSR